MNTYIKNIEKVLSKATNKNYLNGMTWYDRAHKHCKMLSEVYNIPLFQVVGILAALSPRNKWERNLKDVEQVILQGNKARVGTFNKMKHKAVLCLKAKNEHEVIKILNGVKITSFFKNIFYIKDNSVTIDVWAMRVVDFEGNLTAKRYKEIERAYISVANKYEMLPKQVQAITWGVVRNG